MNINFRDVEHNLCIVLDSQILKMLQSENENESNAVICYGYVDKQAGLTFEVLCFASYVNGDYTIVREEKTVSMKIRAESLSFAEIIPIKNQAIIKRFEQRINMIEECYYSGDDIEICRAVSCIDQFRHPYYPDDIEAILTKTGLQAEKI